MVLTKKVANCSAPISVCLVAATGMTGGFSVAECRLMPVRGTSAGTVAAAGVVGGWVVAVWLGARLLDGSLVGGVEVDGAVDGAGAELDGGVRVGPSPPADRQPAASTASPATASADHRRRDMAVIVPTGRTSPTVRGRSVDNGAHR